MSAIKLIESYLDQGISLTPCLDNRNQFLEIGENNSEMQIISIGVAQNSVIGHWPSLFFRGKTKPSTHALPVPIRAKSPTEV